MGTVQKFSSKKPFDNVVSAPPPTGQGTGHDGRDRLRFAAAELAKACDCVAELETRLARLTSIISDADAAHAALQDAIEADGGVELEAYGAGNASGQPIAKLVANKETTAKAASAARDALPAVNDMLAKARAEVARLEGVKFDAVIVFLKTRARDEHDTYIRAFSDLCDAYERLCGIAVAVSATGHADMMTTGLPVPIKVPGFNLSTGPAHGPSELVTLTHSVTESGIDSAASTWMKARELLLNDVDAHIEELIGGMA